MGLSPLQREKKRGSLPKPAVKHLKSWLESHSNNPYPSEKEKEELLKRTGISTGQLCNWFINARRRILPKLIESMQSKKSRRHQNEDEEEDGENIRKALRSRNSKRKRCNMDGDDSDYECSE